MATRTLNVLLTGDPKSLQAAFASSVKASTGVKAGLAGVAVAAGLAGKALYDVGAEFDHAYDKIRVGTGKTGKALEQLKGDFKNVVASVPTDFDAAAEAITEVEKRLGLTGNALRRESKQFLELSRITDSDLAGNIKGVARAFEDWDVPIKRQSGTLDEFFRASQMSGASVEELTTLLAKFGSPLRVLGLDLGEATAMFAEFEKAGVNIQTMVPGLRMALKNFLLEDRDPQNALAKTFEGIEKGTISSSKALEIFGQRAGADMVEAVEQGRFHLAGFQKQVEDGNDTIRKAGKETMDASENFQLLGNKLKVLIEPAAMAVYNAVGKLSGQLAKVNFKRLLHEMGVTSSNFREVGSAIKSLARFVGPVLGDALKGAVQYFKGFMQAVKGISEIISGVLTGDFGKAWRGVKDVFSGGVKAALGLLRAFTAPARAIVGKIGDALGDGFSAAWGKVKSVFRNGVQAVTGFIQQILDVINVLPGVDIQITGGPPSGSHAVATAHQNKNRTAAERNGPAVHRYSGGPITRPMAIVGEEAPQHHEWVIATNPAYRKNNLAYWAQAGRDLGVPGFALGGVWDAAKKAGAGALDTATFGVGSKVLGAAAGGAGSIIGKLPTPNLPGWMGGLGEYAVGKVSDWIKNGFGSGRFGGSGGIGSFSGPWVKVMQQIAQQQGWNLGDWRKLVMQESGGDPTAVNPSSGAFGLGQFLGSTLSAYAKYGATSHDPAKQISAMAHYISDRYGNPTAAWAHETSAGWYAKGGLMKGTAGRAVAWAKNNIGTQQGSKKYGRWIAETEGVADPWCAEFVGAAMLAQGVPLPGNSAYTGSYGSGWAGGEVVGSGLGSAQPGDLLAFGSDDHIGIYVGGGRVVAGNWSDEVAEYSASDDSRGVTRVTRPKYPGGSAVGGAGVGKVAKPKQGSIGSALFATTGTKAGPFGVGGGSAAVLGGLGPTALSAAAAGLPASIRARLASPGIGYTGQVRLAEQAMSMAEGTSGLGDDQAARAFERELFTGREGQLQKSLHKVNAELGKSQTPKQRKRSLAKREHIEEELGGVESSLSGLDSAEAQREEDNTKSNEELAAELKATREEMQTTRQYAERASTTGEAVAWQALADMLAGNLGAMTGRRANAAGIGTVGRV